MAACSSCGAEIVWASMRETSRPMPCDPPELPIEKVVPPVVAVRRRDRLAVVMSEESAAQVRASPGVWAEWSFHTSHWESCPSSAEHRVNPDQGSLL